MTEQERLERIDQIDALIANHHILIKQLVEEQTQLLTDEEKEARLEAILAKWAERANIIKD